MGMAASQARFLSLTARKSNVEYEGQQINQERTALANESSNLYAELTKLDVPAPPNTSDFYKTVYTFVSRDISEKGEKLTYTLEEILPTIDGDKALLSYKEPFFAAASENLSYSKENPAKITDGLTEADRAKDPDIDKLYKGKTLSGKKVTDFFGDDYQILTAKAEEFKTTLDALGNSDAGNKGFADAYFNADGSLKADADVYYYEKDNQKYFILPDEFTKGETSTSYKVAQEHRNVQIQKDVTNYEVNDQGRTTSVTIKVGEKEGEPIVQTYDLECTSVEDEEAYHQAMLDYEYYQSQYEKKVTDINSKTEAIQQKDKTLELELKQLDTDQNAISTEMDAVKKVIEDNVEATFKTFG